LTRKNTQVFRLEPPDPRLDLYRSTSDAELLRRHGLFVAEGRLVVERVLQSGRYEAVSALLNDAALAAVGPVFESCAPDVPVYCIETPAFEQVTGFNIHRGCLALVRRPAPLDWREAIGSSRLIVVLEGVTNADNVGGVFRNAAAFGAGAVLLSPTCCDPLYRKAVRTSVGAVLSVPFARLTPWLAGLSELRQAGFSLAAFTPREPAHTLMEISNALTHKNALIFGSEAAGLSEGAAHFADVRVRIPMTPAIDSLNVAVATGVALYVLTAQRRAS
jgi:tRNA G18 (ribose-2'-O)-methylase SpoU